MTDQLERELDTNTPQNDLDGLCFIGTIVRVEAVKFKGSDDPISGLAKLVMSSAKTDEFRIDLSKTARQITGDVDLPAFPLLVQAMPGTRWLVTLWKTTSTTDGKTYVNYTAVDAARI